MDLSLTPNVLGYIAGFPITNTFWVAVLLSVILILVFLKGTYRMKEVPRGLQLWLEIIVDGSRQFVRESAGSDVITHRLHPWVLTIFLMFLVGNLLSFIPGLPSMTFNGQPLYRTATTDYNMVLIISLFFVIIVQMTTIMTGGIFTYLKKFINPTSPLNFILGFFDIIGELAKLISLSFRFFGNAFAAEVLVAVLLFIFPYVLPLPFMSILLLSSIVQPAVFALLVMIYIQMAVVQKEAIEEKAENREKAV